MATKEERAALTPAALRELSAEQLSAKLAELSEERFRLRFRSATESIENPMRFRALRRDIARIQTILRERSGERAVQAGA